MKKIYIAAIILMLAGFTAGWLVADMRPASLTAQDLVFEEEEAAVRAIKQVIPAVVSIQVFDEEQVLQIDLEGESKVITDNIQKGNGTGFLISSDGYILTNKHVVTAAGKEGGQYRVTLNSGKKYYAQRIGVDPLMDLAILKIFDKDLPYAEMGDSNLLEIGSSVIAIGNSLGRYQNSATKGIVSGLGRFLVSKNLSTGKEESLANVIQTDAEINLGNSGGPLINLQGEVVGVNVAVDEAGNSIGFALPINDVRPIVNSVRDKGVISRARLGAYYMMLTPAMAEEFSLPRDSGAWLSTGHDEGIEIISPGSPAAEAGLEAGDIIFEVNAVPVAGKNTLSQVIQRYKPGDRIGLKLQRGEKILIREVVLDSF